MKAHPCNPRLGKRPAAAWTDADTKTLLRLWKTTTGGKMARCRQVAALMPFGEKAIFAHATTHKLPYDTRIYQRINGDNCRHCGRVRPRGQIKRGLCCACYHRADIRDQYRPLSHNKTPGTTTPTALAAAPCTHPPGSEERIAALSARVSAGVLLWHPNDVRMDLR